jgi:hypothetical protein
LDVCKCYCFTKNFQLKNDGTATVEKLPNHKVFDTISADNLALLSPLQLRHLQAQKENAPAMTSPQIHNYISFPDNLFALLANKSNLPVAPPESCSTLSAMLLPNEYQPGLTYSIEEFCTQFKLSNLILTKLKDNGYSCTHTIKFIEVSELQSMGFKFGEIAELKEAVWLWAVQPLPR